MEHIQKPEWELFDRANGKGDLFDSFRQMMKRGEKIPVDFYRINDPSYGYDYRPDLKPSLLDDSIRRLNEIYGKVAQNRLVFSRREIYEAELCDEIFRSLELIDGCLKVKIQDPPDWGFGIYAGNGIVQLHPNVFLNMDLNFLTFPHEVGHGIIGYGHCKYRDCLMFISSDYSDGNFCDGDRQTFSRLAD